MESAPANSAAAARAYRFEFRGTAGEYFKIWTANVVLTVLTFGIYAPWAKVRRKRYFYANTFLDGANFEYHANPLSILVSRLILLALILGGGYWAGESIARNAVHSSLLAFLLPWALVRGFSFNARNSSHRNVRMSFRREYRRMYLICAPLIAAYVLPAYSLYIHSLLTGLLWPSESVREILIFYAVLTAAVVLFTPPFFRAFHRIKADCHAWGALRFLFRPPPLKKYWILPALWIIFPLFFGLLLWLYNIVAEATDALDVDRVRRTYNLFFASIYFMVFASVLAYLASGVILFRLYWSGIAFDGGEVRCNVSFWRFLINIRLVNLFAVVLSLGLLHPWAAVRKTRFLAANMQIAAAPGAMENILARRGADESAFGEEFEAAQGFDFDVGLI